MAISRARRTNFPILGPASRVEPLISEVIKSTAFPAASESSEVKQKRLNLVNTHPDDKRGASHITTGIDQIMESNCGDTLYVSSTAQQSGYGSDQYKRVTFLTPLEREQVKSGERIFFLAQRISAKGPNGTYWRVAKVFGASIGPRVPSLEEIALLRQRTGKV